MKTLRILVVFAFFTAATAGPARADEISELKDMIQDLKKDYESRIQKLEAKIEKLESSQEKKVEEKVAEMKKEIEEKAMNVEYVGRYDGAFGKGGLTVDMPAANSRVTLGGYMDHEFENFENTKSTFDQHRWIINIGAEIGERLRFFSEYEIEHGGPSVDGGEAKVEQAWVDYLIEEWVNLRAGAVLMPFGRTNIYHNSDLRDLTSRPLVARDIIPTTWTESGAGIYGSMYPIIGDYEDLMVSYETYVVNGLDDGFSDTGLRGARGSLSSDNNNSKAVVGRVVLSPKIGHELGLSGYWGRYNTAGDAINGKAVDWKSVFGPFELVGEYAYFDVKGPDFPGTGLTDIADTLQGYRVQANYHFWPEFLDDTFLGRGFDDPVFTLVGRYGWAEIDDDSDTGTGDNEEERFTLGLNYRPVESWVFKMEYQWNETDNESLERGDNNGFMWSVAMGF